MVSNGGILPIGSDVTAGDGDSGVRGVCFGVSSSPLETSTNIGIFLWTRPLRNCSKTVRIAFRIFSVYSLPTKHIVGSVFRKMCSISACAKQP